MSQYLGDQQRQSYFLNRDHEKGVPVDLRTTPKGFKLEIQEDIGKYKDSDPGDWVCWTFWRERQKGDHPNQRPLGGWSPCFPSVSTVFGLLPIKTASENADGSFFPKFDTSNSLSVSPGNTSFRNTEGHPLPYGMTSILLQGTDPDSYQQIAFPVQGPLIAHHERTVRPAASGETSSSVFDLTPDGYMDWDKAGRLHSLLRVRQIHTSLFVPCLNLHKSEGDDTGWGAVYAPYADLKKQEPVAQVSGSSSPAWTPIAQNSPSADGGVAFVSWAQGGYCSPGHRKDKHSLGTDDEGNGVNSAHIPTSALFYDDASRDAPMEFSQRRYPGGTIGNVRYKVFLSYDAKDSHDWVLGRKPGKWKWWTTGYWEEPKPPKTVTEKEIIIKEQKGSVVINKKIIINKKIVHIHKHFHGVKKGGKLKQGEKPGKPFVHDPPKNPPPKPQIGEGAKGTPPGPRRPVITPRSEIIPLFMDGTANEHAQDTLVVDGDDSMQFENWEDHVAARDPFAESLDDVPESGSSYDVKIEPESEPIAPLKTRYEISAPSVFFSAVRNSTAGQIYDNRFGGGSFFQSDQHNGGEPPFVCHAAGFGATDDQGKWSYSQKPGAFFQGAGTSDGGIYFAPPEVIPDATTSVAASATAVLLDPGVSLAWGTPSTDGSTLDGPVISAAQNAGAENDLAVAWTDSLGIPRTDGVIDTQARVEVAQVALATLPAAAAGNMGQMVFVTDARKPGEGAGLGTGTLVYSDSINWVSVCDCTTAAT